MHQHSYFELEVPAGLNQERERELSSVFDKLLVTLCGKHQTNLLKKTPCMLTQSTPQISDFQKIKRQNILTVSNSYE